MSVDVTYFEHSQKERFLVPNQGAPNVTHNEISNMSALERIMLSMARCEVCKRRKMTLTSVNMKTLKNHWKNVYKLAQGEIQ